MQRFEEPQFGHPWYGVTGKFSKWVNALISRTFNILHQIFSHLQNIWQTELLFRQQKRKTCCNLYQSLKFACVVTVSWLTPSSGQINVQCIGAKSVIIALYPSTSEFSLKILSALQQPLFAQNTLTFQFWERDWTPLSRLLCYLQVQRSAWRQRQAFGCKAERHHKAFCCAISSTHGGGNGNPCAFSEGKMASIHHRLLLRQRGLGRMNQNRKSFLTSFRYGLVDPGHIPKAEGTGQTPWQATSV